MMKRVMMSCLFLALMTAPVWGQTAAPESEECAQAKALVTRLQTRLQDWPALNRYREANTKVAPPAKGERRVVFIGDSITDGWKLASYFSGKPYVNRGISGQT